MEEQIFIGTGGHYFDLLFHGSEHNNDLLVLKQCKGALNWIMPSLLGHLENNDLARRSLSFKKASELRHMYPVTPVLSK